MVAQRTSKTQYQIRPAEWKDLSALRKLERVCFPRDRWPILDLIAVLSFPGIVRYKAVSNERLIGFIAGETRSRENVAWISTIAVHPDFRRQGIATALLDICESELKTPSVRLTVRKTNIEAIQLYDQRGYQMVGIMREYYGDNEDGIIYEKRLFS